MSEDREKKLIEAARQQLDRGTLWGGEPPVKLSGEENQPAPAKTLPAYVGRYLVKRVLGQGGFGIVYLAHDEQLDRSVAVKVPHARHLASSEAGAAYLAEARLVAGLDHPNIVPVYDVGSDSQYPCFIVSKFVPGDSLSVTLQRGIPAWADSCRIVARVAEALHFAHKQGIVHRDIKPANILLDAQGVPHLLDFGIALREQQVGRQGDYVGTPA